MKRLTSLVLALLLALTMMVGAFAETADVTGEWYGELLGIQVTLTISTETTEEELQGKWQATSVIMNGMSVPMSMVGQECIIEVKDSKLYLLNLVGQTALAEIPIPMTFVDGILTVTLPVDKNTTQMFGVAKLTDGTLLFELVQGDTTMDFLMEAVPEDAEPAAAE